MSKDAAALPPGEYAIVELFGHTTLVGRVEEVERFGSKMLALEPLFCGTMLPAIFHGGAAIYRMTPCSAETAFAQQPRQTWQLPKAIACIVPPAMLEASTHEATDVEEVDQDEDDRPV